MSDNVIILGAGASADAQIPLMSNFIETMWEMSVRGKIRSEKLTPEDRTLISEAMVIKDRLDNYHGRANFNDRNVEDVLSILSFDAMAGGRTHRKRLSTFVKAISRTIELTSAVRHNGRAEHQPGYPAPYMDLWRLLIQDRLQKTGSFPPIVTFNYDLVLERSLYNYCTTVSHDSLPFRGLSIAYYYDKLPRVDLSKVPIRTDQSGRSNHHGTWLAPAKEEDTVSIEILKLHGSINFPRIKPTQQNLPVLAVDDPLVMPPVFSKMEYGIGLRDAWKRALLRLRQAKNIIIVGYSLPTTDIYMQYFLKAGLGPNMNLNRVFVFDPVLYKESEACEAMIRRYKTCFSPQLQDRIIFRPSHTGDGTLQHFVNKLGAVLF